MSASIAGLDPLVPADAFVGIDERVPTAGGGEVRYVNLDNAATTPPLRAVADAVWRAMRTYGPVHRGAGHKARVSTAAYEDAHRTMLAFAGADPAGNIAIFGRNTTDALNKLANRLPMPPGAVVVSTLLEHHSNDLPWRRRATVVRARVTPGGHLDEDDFDCLLRRHAGRIAAVTVSGASNVTGLVQPIHRLARKAHAAGACLVVDAAQLVAHRPLDMKRDDDPEHLDFVAFSGHKMYAPFGSGVLIGPRSAFLDGDPDVVGGGTVDLVTEDHVEWAGAPDREEAGTPNAFGALAMAEAARQLKNQGFDRIAGHEAALAHYARGKLREVPGITIYGDDDTAERVGAISFNLATADHALVAAVLGYEGGIGVRNGCFCAQPYAARLLGVPETEHRVWSSEQQARPGMVRISLGLYNAVEDIDRAVAILHDVAAGRRGHSYERIAADEYAPPGHAPARTSV